MDDPLTILVAARDEEAAIARTVAELRRGFPDAEVIVADDGSSDRTADVAEEAGAIVLRLPRRGKGQALSAAERAAPPGRLLLCDADLAGDLTQLANGGADLTVAAFAERIGGGFGIVKRVARDLIELCGGVQTREPLSGQRSLSPSARAACFPVAAGFGCEVRMTIDAARARGDSERWPESGSRVSSPARRRISARAARLAIPKPPPRLSAKTAIDRSLFPSSSGASSPSRSASQSRSRPGDTSRSASVRACPFPSRGSRTTRAPAASAAAAVESREPSSATTTSASGNDRRSAATVSAIRSSSSRAATRTVSASATLRCREGW